MNGTPLIPELSIASTWSSSFSNTRSWSPAQRYGLRCEPIPPPRDSTMKPPFAAANRLTSR